MRTPNPQSKERYLIAMQNLQSEMLTSNFVKISGI
jgi:hypothetical protein